MSNEILVSTRKGLFTLNRGRAGWQIANAEFLGDNVSMALQDRRDGTRYAAFDHGHFGVKLKRCRKGGSWEEIGVPAYPKQPEGEVDKDMMGRTIPWTLTKIWALEPGADGETGRLWCGTLPGGLFRSDDHGTSWTLIDPLWRDERRKFWMGGGYDVPGIHSICVDPRDARTVRVAVSCGGIWTSRDAGTTWDCFSPGIVATYAPPEHRDNPVAQDPHLLVQCPGEPDGLWVQHHNGIFVSRDGGSQWSEVKQAGPSTFGFSVAVHPERADTAWFVPAVKDEFRYPVDGRFVVTRTRDGGRTFETLSDGLPQQHAYDLVYRHGLAVDPTGERLVMGSTTGSLWVSEDQGTHWQTVSAHLPPVHAVRWA